MLKPLLKQIVHRLPGLAETIRKRDEALKHRERVIAELTARNDLLTLRNRDLTSILVWGAKAALSTTEPSPDGWPVPHPILRFLVAGDDRLDWFFEGGQLASATIRDLLARRGVGLDQLSGILDFGCGCGRVIRHLASDQRRGLYGCDVNAVAIDWCRQYLPFAQFAANELTPPLPYPDRSFELVYAFSVFTHLAEPLQAPWMAELRRLLRPGGYLVLSTMGDWAREWLTAPERLAYDSGRLVVRTGEDVGMNSCGVYHPESYVRTVLSRGFEVLEFVPRGARGNPLQDVYLLRPAAAPPPA